MGSDDYHTDQESVGTSGIATPVRGQAVSSPSSTAKRAPPCQCPGKDVSDQCPPGRCESASGNAGESWNRKQLFKQPAKKPSPSPSQSSVEPVKPPDGSGLAAAASACRKRPTMSNNKAGKPLAGRSQSQQVQSKAAAAALAEATRPAKPRGPVVPPKIASSAAPAPQTMTRTSPAASARTAARGGAEEWVDCFYMCDVPAWAADRDATMISNWVRRGCWQLSLAAGCAGWSAAALHEALTEELNTDSGLNGCTVRHETDAYIEIWCEMCRADSIKQHLVRGTVCGRCRCFAFIFGRPILASKPIPVCVPNLKPRPRCPIPCFGRATRHHAMA